LGSSRLQLGCASGSDIRSRARDRKNGAARNTSSPHFSGDGSVLTPFP
jgi:hypothetical protein